MSKPAFGRRAGQIFQRTYVPTLATNAGDLSKVYIRDTLIIDDTGGTGSAVVTLPKIGTAYAPVGKRVTLRKASTVAQTVSIKPATADVISATAPAAYPGFGTAGTANTSALPASLPNSVTIEATNMNITGSTQPNAAGGTPTTAGAWMIVASSVASI